MTSSIQVRSALVETIELDLVGPRNDHAFAHELLPQSPQRWYLCVTPYAATSTGEDFAEVFWLYLKHKGQLPRRIDTAPIRRKWKFVEELRKG